MEEVQDFAKETANIILSKMKELGYPIPGDEEDLEDQIDSENQDSSTQNHNQREEEGEQEEQEEEEEEQEEEEEEEEEEDEEEEEEEVIHMYSDPENI